jgi:hypothetical protein
MANKEVLPDGGWALIRAAEEVPERLRRAYLEAQGAMLAASGASISEDGKVDMATLNTTAMSSAIGPTRDALILAYTKAWSLIDDEGGALPLTSDSILDLPGGVFDALHKVCEAAYKLGNGGVVSPDPAGAGDPESPIVPLVE